MVYITDDEIVSKCEEIQTSIDNSIANWAGRKMPPQLERVIERRRLKIDDLLSEADLPLGQRRYEWQF